MRASERVMPAADATSDAMTESEEFGREETASTTEGDGRRSLRDRNLRVKVEVGSYEDIRREEEDEEGGGGVRVKVASADGVGKRGEGRPFDAGPNRTDAGPRGEEG